VSQLSDRPASYARQKLFAGSPRNSQLASSVRFALSGWARSPEGSKKLRYAATSAITVVVTETSLFLLFGVARIAGPVPCQIVASMVATVPGYALHRHWTWKRSGRSDWLREALPFWAIAVAGLATALVADVAGAALAHRLGLPHTEVAAVVDAASIAGFGVVWVGRFLLLDRIVFRGRSRPSATD